MNLFPHLYQPAGRFYFERAAVTMIPNYLGEPLLWFTFDCETAAASIREVIKVHQAALEAAYARRSQATTDQHWAAIRYSEETGIIDSLLGVSFVMLQSYITTVTTLAERHFGGRNLRGIPSGKFNLMRFRSPMSSQTGKPEFILDVNAVANFFKHRDEWPVNWSAGIRPHGRKLSQKEQQQIDNMDRVAALGMDEEPANGLRQAVRVLSDGADDGLLAILDSLVRWQENIAAAIHACMAIVPRDKSK